MAALHTSAGHDGCCNPIANGKALVDATLAVQFRIANSIVVFNILLPHAMVVATTVVTM